MPSGGSYNHPASWRDTDASLYSVTNWRSIVDELRERCPDTPGCVEFCAELTAYIERAQGLLDDFDNLVEPLRAVDLLCSCDYGVEDMAKVLAEWKPKETDR